MLSVTRAASLVVGSAVLLAGILRAWPVHARHTSAADLLTSYVAWAERRAASVPLAALDLDAARSELNRLAPIFLLPLHSTIHKVTGACPALTFDVDRVGERVSTTISTSAETRFEGVGSCQSLRDGSLVRVIRQVTSSLPAARVVIEDVGNSVGGGSATQHAAWEADESASDEHQRRMLTAFALELAETGAGRQAAAAARLIEWACPRVRTHLPLNDFDRAWQLAALSLLEGAMDFQALEIHVGHVAAAFADEPRVILARGIVEEQSMAPFEVLDGRADAARAARAFARPGAARDGAVERAVTDFLDAAHEPSLRGEAALRRSHVLIGAGRYDDALAALPAGTAIETMTTDGGLVYLTYLFRGLAFDGLDRSADAKASYLQALGVSPSAHSGVMALAALEFRTGHGGEANGLLNTLLRDDDPRRDPWWSYYAADWRFWYPRITRLRALTEWQ
jgi:tetratricopeptide (TPR) repeat protein